MSITMGLVLVNIAFFLANGLLFPRTNLLTGLMAVVPGTLGEPAVWWKFLTYGFAHSPVSFWHIGGNMIALIMFGYGLMLGIGPGGFGFVRGENVEERLGRGEYLIFYLLTIIFSGVVFSAVKPDAASIGASGGVTGVVVLYAMLYPRKVLFIWGVLPLPMWAIGLLIVVMDAQGANGTGNQGVAYEAHLAGAAFALFYYAVFLRTRRRITDSFAGFGKMFKSKPKLRVFDDAPKPEPKQKSAQDVEFEKRLDEILDRYGKVGESGLTPEEREFLQRASKRYRNKER